MRNRLMGKKAMEMWQLILMILALIVLIAFLAWYAGLGGVVDKLFEKLGELF